MASTKVEPTTTVALRDGSGEVEVSLDFADRFPAIAPTVEMMEIFQENLEGEDLGVSNFKRIKVPSAELNGWVVTMAGEERSMRELVGVIVAIKARRSYWATDASGDATPDGSPPDCASTDNKTPDAGGWYHPAGEMGAQNPTGLCRNCPMSQRGSDPKSDQGSACREQRLLFVATHGAVFPVIVTVPRTSVKNVIGYAMDLSETGLPYNGVETSLTLGKAKNRKGQAYNTVQLQKVGELSKDERRAAQVYGKEIKAMIDAAAADFSDAAATETAANGGVSVGTGPE